MKPRAGDLVRQANELRQVIGELAVELQRANKLVDAESKDPRPLFRALNIWERQLKAERDLIVVQSEALKALADEAGLEGASNLILSVQRERDLKEQVRRLCFFRTEATVEDADLPKVLT